MFADKLHYRLHLSQIKFDCFFFVFILAYDDSGACIILIKSLFSKF